LPRGTGVSSPFIEDPLVAMGCIFDTPSVSILYSIFIPRHKQVDKELNCSI
jgi:hypothetical protein